MRKNIGLLFRNDENWIGGTYYILNLIHAIKRLPENKLPQLFLICETEIDFNTVVKETGYKFLVPVIYKINTHEKPGFFKSRKFKKLFSSIDLVFPYPFKDDQLIANVKRKIFWVGDFQEKYLPDFFSPQAIENREKINQKIAASGGEVVFSSSNAMEDFDRFYSGHTCKKYLLNFAVTHPNITKVDPEKVKAKYEVKSPYFISPNQFWIHKNHHLIIDAIKKMVDSGKDVCLIFTGKEYDYRYPEYTDQLKKKVEEYGLQKQIRFLGFIDRLDQLVLMKNAEAVVQASLFEGWSTVVEDAKALNSYIILSDIPVHREQSPTNVCWFDPHSVDSLIDTMAKSKPALMVNDYSLNKMKYINQFEKIIEG